MGSPKPLLPLGEATFLANLLYSLRASRARPIVVVLGHEAAAVRAGVDLGDARAVDNPSYRDGMLSSIRAGIGALDDDVLGALLLPVDHPRVSARLVDSLIDRFLSAQAPIVVPTFNGRRGHPVLFGRALFGELLHAPEAVGARQVVWDHASEVLEVPADEPHVLEDVDTQADYRRLIEK